MEEGLPAEIFPGEWNKAVECPWDRAQYRDDFSPRYRREYYSDSASARDKVSAVAVDTPAALNMWLFGVTLGGATAMSCSRWSEPKSETAKQTSKFMLAVHIVALIIRLPARVNGPPMS
jgi:hypothetical protein